MNFRLPIADCRLPHPLSLLERVHTTSSHAHKAALPKSAIGNRHSAIAFTLTELLVAVTLTAIMILAINQIFATVSESVSRGAGVSEILTTHQIISQQLREDFTQMLGPSSNGVLVIANHLITDPDPAYPGGITGVHVLPADDLDQNGHMDTGEPGASTPGPARNVRDDQIMFIRRRGDAQPLTPEGEYVYTSTTDAAFIKVWYGHPVRTHPIGVMNTNGNTTWAADQYEVAFDTALDPLGQPDRIGGAGGVEIPGINQFASTWIFARQALFLQTTPRLVPPTTNQWYAHALGAFFDAQTSGLGGTTGSGANSDTLRYPFLNPDFVAPVTNTQQSLFMALTDVATYGLAVLDETNPANENALVGDTATAAQLAADSSATIPPNANRGNRRLWRNLPAEGAIPRVNGYAPRAYLYMYLPTSPSDDPAYAADRRRLWCNPTPTADLDGDGILDVHNTQAARNEVDNYYSPWQLAQMHPYLAGRVSDIVIEFAGDYFRDTAAAPLPVLPGDNPNDPTVVLTADRVPDGIIDHYDDISDNDVGVIWYGLTVQPPVNTSGTPPYDPGEFINAIATTTAVQNPIYDESYDTLGGTPSIPNYDDIRYIFRHGSPGGDTNNWPHLIRIRYRLHDSQGRIIDPDGEPGRWFEIILTVNRN